MYKIATINNIINILKTNGQNAKQQIIDCLENLDKNQIQLLIDDLQRYQDNIKVCRSCEKEILHNEEYYTNNYDSDYHLCKYCGEELLVFNDNFEDYILRDDNKDYYLDDSMSDIDTFKFSKNKIL